MRGLFLYKEDFIMMNQKELSVYDDGYKKSSILVIMNTIANVKECYNITGTNPMLYYKRLEDTIIKDMENNKDIQKDSRFYKLIEKYLSVLVYGNIYFYHDGISYRISADMLYNTYNKNSYDKITLCCTISAELCEKTDKYITRFKNIKISPSLKLSYKNITTICESNPIYVKNETSYSFYEIYIKAKNSLRTPLIENDCNMENSIEDMINIEYLLQDMAMLITLFYMKSIVPIDDYSKFLKLDEKKENVSSMDVNDISLELKHYNEIGRNIFNIESSLYDIGTKDLDLLKDTLKKINNIVNESKSKIK